MDMPISVVLLNGEETKFIPFPFAEKMNSVWNGFEKEKTKSLFSSIEITLGVKTLFLCLRFEMI